MAGSIVVPILTAFNAAGVRAAQSSLSGLSGSLTGLGKSALKASAGVLAIQAAVAGIRFAGQAVTEASNLQRNLNGLETVFGSLTPQMTIFAQNAVSMGMSTSEAAKASTFLGSVLKGAGFEMSSVATETQKLTGLAADLATVYGYDVQEALTAMTALFRGEYDPIEKFGVAMKQNEVNAVLASKGLGDLTGQALLNAQQMVRLELLYQRTSDASGAFARSQGTLFVEQQKLQAAFKNSEAAIGTALLPAITNLIEVTTPFIEKITPALSTLFGAFGTNLSSITPLLSALGDTFAILMSVIADISKVFADLISVSVAPFTAAIEALNPVLEFLGGIISIVAKLVGAILVPVLGIFTGILTIAIRLLVQLASVFDPVIKAFTTFFAPLGPILDEATKGFTDFFNLIANGPKEINWTSGVNTTSIEGILAASAVTKTPKKLGTDTKNAVTDFFKKLQDEVEQQAAKLKLTNLGASEAFAESIIGSGEGWKKVFDKVIAGGKVGVAKLQATFNKTSAGLKEIESAQKAAADKAAELKAKFDEATTAFNKFKESIGGVVKQLSPLSLFEQEVGRHEQNIVASFDAIRSSIADALDNGVLTRDAATNLKAYADKAIGAMAAIAKQRDALADKIDAAKSLISETKNSIRDFGNITSLLEQQSKTITQTVTYMSGELQISISQQLEQVATAGDITKNFQNVLDKTKKFASQLKELRRLGLNGTLFQQIVSAGVDAGGATAEAILSGGAGTIGEINNIFGELDTVSGQIAEQTAQVMYGAGVDITNGLISGLLSQDEMLRAAAKALSDSFTSSFNTEISKSIPSMSGVVGGGTVGEKFDIANPPDWKRSPQRYAQWLSAIGGIDPNRSPERYAAAQAAKGMQQPIVLQVDGKNLAEAMVTYQRVNGQIWATAN